MEDLVEALTVIHAEQSAEWDLLGILPYFELKLYGSSNDLQVSREAVIKA